MRARLPVPLLVGFLACFFFSSCASAPRFSSGRVVDLTHPFDSSAVYWPTESGFVLENETQGMTSAGYYYASNRFSAPEHGGTHIDASRHFAENGRTIEQIPVGELMGPGIVVDVSVKCSQDRDYQINVSDFLEWEREHGKIPDGAMVLLRTGFEKYWPDRVSYMGTDERGKTAVAKLHFPGLHPDAAKWLAHERRVKAVGLDTPSIDYGQSKEFGSHVIFCAKNISALENLANLGELPAKGFTVIALPMDIKGGTGAPVRVIAVE